MVLTDTHLDALFEASFAIASKEAAQLAVLRLALEEGRDADALRIARWLVGLDQEAIA
jgi:hypothetical protein